MKTALQLTMQYVRNYGSALQTYALQRAIESVPGWRCETLDIHPHWTPDGWSMLQPVPAAPASRTAWFADFMRRLKHAGLHSLTGRISSAYRSRFVIRPWERMFDDFLRNEIRLAPRSYWTIDELKADPPSADLYITGSDQTFNPRFTRAENFWFWSFLPDGQLREGRKISYAASFACARLRDDCREAYKRWLPTYQALSVRESSGVKIARELGVRATHCCDPTLLLDRAAWKAFASRGTCAIRRPYILCYNLRYAVDPYPMAESLEREISKKLGLSIIHLQEGPVQWTSPTGRILRGVSIPDFVNLFLNASFIMTSSFHGTAFALQSGVPFLTYVNKNANADSRAYDLLATCKAERHALAVSDALKEADDLARFEPRAQEAEGLARFREASRAWLHNEMAAAAKTGMGERR